MEKTKEKKEAKALKAAEADILACLVNGEVP